MVPSTRQGPFYGSARFEVPQEATVSRLCLAVRPKNGPKSPNEGLGKRRRMSARVTAAPTRFLGFQHSRWGRRSNDGRPGLAIRPRRRELLRERRKVLRRAVLSLSTCVGHWLEGRTPEDQYRTLGPGGWPRPNIGCQGSKVMFHG